MLEAYLDGATIDTIQQRTARKNRHALQPEERAVMKLLQRRLAGR